MRYFYIAFLVFSFLAATILPPLAMEYAERQQAAAISQLPPCHQQMAKQEAAKHPEKSPCGQDALHCKCCVIHAALPENVPHTQHHTIQLTVARASAALVEYHPELLLPPPEFTS